MWTFAKLIEHEHVIDFEYENDKGIIKHFSNALPVSIIVDTYYVYVVIFYANSKNHFYNYRLDRFLAFNGKNNREVINNYHMHQELHFNEPKVHRENPLMQIGDVTTTTIEFTGILEALKDKFPNSSVIKTDDSIYTIRITANWTSLKMWLLSQGTRVKILSPQSLVADYQETLREMLELNA
ncbi:helix-turn-helix transcriptional regulator [Weissella viridescens]|uniref:helix-turn-helix transcriptional regulator n=1 Tax=Weissella viridescens TaxID=1629 RepID=UPI0040568AFC